MASSGMSELEGPKDPLVDSLCYIVASVANTTPPFGKLRPSEGKMFALGLVPYITCYTYSLFITELLQTK